MTAAKAVVDDRKTNEPTSEEVTTYTKREKELRGRFLKGVLHIQSILDGLQDLMGLRAGFINCDTRPEIPSWADQENPIIKHIPCGYVEHARITAGDVFRYGDSDFLDGEEYITRAQKLDSYNACGFDFYAKPENWKYLPPDVDILVFPKTEFRDADGRRRVRCLCRDGAEWDRYYHFVDSRFSRLSRVAMLASPQLSST